MDTNNIITVVLFFMTSSFLNNLMAVFLICKVYHLIYGQALPRLVADKIFLFHRPSGHGSPHWPQAHLKFAATSRT
jgi:hypothetical protein